jgi:large subunit ribosomal protein L21
MYAVVEAGGRQYQLTSGRYVDVELVSAEPDQEFVFEKVLAIVNGQESVIGAPFVDGARVTGKVIAHGKGPKLIVYKYRPKKGTRKRTGHRQGYTRIFISSIKLNDKVVSEATDKGKSAAPPTKDRPAAEAPKKETAVKAENPPGKTAPDKKPAKDAPPGAESKDKPKAPAKKKSEE